MISPDEQKIITEFLEALSENVDDEINFLVEFFGYEQEDLDEVGCLEISQMVRDSISEYDFDDIKDLVQDFHVDGFDMNKFNGEMKQPCNNPCKSCPYRNDAIKGYFGGQNPQEYADAIHMDTVVACHTRTKHNNETGMPKNDGNITICTGHIISQIKVFKSSKHTDGIKAHDFVKNLDNFEELKENALGFDFKDYHEI